MVAAGRVAGQVWPDDAANRPMAPTDPVERCDLCRPDGVLTSMQQARKAEKDASAAANGAQNGAGAMDVGGSTAMSDGRLSERWGRRADRTQGEERQLRRTRIRTVRRPSQRPDR